MPRAKQSDWKAPELDVLDGDLLLPPTTLQKCLDHLRAGISKVGLRRIEVTLKNVAAKLNLELHFRQQPTGGEIEVALRRLREALRSAQQAYAALDSASLQVLETAARLWSDHADVFQSHEYQRQIDAGFPLDLGSIRVAHARRVLAALNEWSITDSKPSPARRHKMEQERDAIRELNSIWERWQRPGATAAERDSFFRSVLHPVHERYGLEPQMDALIQEMLPPMSRR